jgi:catechol 2,3-dioxygenase-like lactoylglutathione lyase family enzyme
MTDPTESLGLTDLFHVGLVIHDLDGAMRRYTELGIGPWATFDADMPGTYRGRETAIAARVAFARSGPTYLELVQPTNGEWTASVFLKERGEGAYHLGYWVEDLDDAVKRAVTLGYAIDIVSERGGFAYLDATNTAGLHMELVSTRNRPAIEQFVAGAEAL